VRYCEKHDICIGCGIKRKDLKEIPWNARIGAFQCRDCETKERQKNITARQAQGFSHEWENEITCPYCGYKFGDSWEYGSDDGVEDCPECEKTFKYNRHVLVNYSTEKMEKQ
jgi:hypothetical protein